MLEKFKELAEKTDWTKLRPFFHWKFSGVLIPVFWGSALTMSGITLIGSCVFLTLTFVWTLGFWLNSDWLLNRNPRYWGKKKKKHTDINRAQTQFRYYRNGVSLLIFVVFLVSLFFASYLNKEAGEIISKLENILSSQARIEQHLSNIANNWIVGKNERETRKPTTGLATRDELKGNYIHDVSFRLIDLIEEPVYVIKGKTFENCNIYGPSIVGLRGGEVTFSSWENDANNSIFIVAPQPTIMGVIGLENCVIRRCKIYGIGIIDTKENLEHIKKGFKGAS
jgi:hypothetical protein